MMPLWVGPVSSAVGACVLVAAALLIEEWIGRRRSIDLTDLTVDHDAPVDELLDRVARYTVDPPKRSTAEIQRLHRVRAQDFQDGLEIRRRMGGGLR